MLSKLLDVGAYYNAWQKVKDQFKDFKFTKIDLGYGNEMVRTSWFGRHDMVPYVRIDLWRVGFRISYDPDYCKRYFFEYQPLLTEKQQTIVKEYVNDRLLHDTITPKRHISREGQIIEEPVDLWKGACRLVEQEGWV